MRAEAVRPELASPRGTELLCENLTGAGFEALSDQNVRIFCDRLLDMTGCIFGGAAVPEDRFFYELLRRQGGAPHAPLFTMVGRLPLMSAVSMNCLLARANDYGNMYVEIFGEGIASHFGETLIPMGLTLADVRGVTGREFIANNIIAEDTAARVLYTLPVRWPTDMQLVSSAAAALAARYYRLDAKQAKVALSYAATNATDPGNSYYDYCQEFKLHNAESARMGVLAAEIAKSGSWNGLEDPFFGHWGLITGKLPEGELPELYERAFDGLGKSFYTETRFKKGPGGIPTTAAGECGKKLRAQIIERCGSLDPDKIKRVRVLRSSSTRYNYYSNPFRLRSHVNALFSYQFAACCALLLGDRRVLEIQTPAIRANERLVELTEQSEMGVYECEPGRQTLKAEAEMTDGLVFSAETDYAASMLEYPAREFLLAKFREQFEAFGKLPRSVGEEIIRLATRIDTLNDMREYTSLLTL